MNITHGFGFDRGGMDTPAVELVSHNGLVLTVMEYSNKGVIIVTCDLSGNELSRILIGSEHGHKGEIYGATTMGRLDASLG